MATEDTRQCTADLAHRRVAPHRVDDCGHDIPAPPRDRFNLMKRSADSRLLSASAGLLEPLQLAAKNVMTDREDRNRLRLMILDEAVDTYDHAVPALNLRLLVVGRFSDCLLQRTVLDRLHDPSPVLNLTNQIGNPAVELVR